MQGHPDLQTKKLLGAYYTPTALSDVLARFALSSPNDTVLEPSFGGGAFVRSALNCLSELGADSPEKQIYGCDIDVHAFEHLPNYFGRRMGREGRRFILRDFLEVDPQSFMIRKFDCVLANPPFIGYSKLSENQRDHAKVILDKFNLKKNRYASLWYYFILNSLLNLKTGGRIAFILPHAFIDNNYAMSLREYLARNFKSVATFSLPDRIFSAQGTKERVVVLAALGWQETSNNVVENAIHVDNFDDLENHLNSLKNLGKINLRQLRCAAGRVSGALSNSEASLVNEVINSSATCSFGDFVDVKIGLVTGDASFFTFNRQKVIEYGLSESKHFDPLMRSLKENKGIAFNSDDLSTHVNDGKDYFLLRYTDKLLKCPRYLRYLNTYDFSKIDSNRTFNKRDNWCEVDDGNISDLFLSYMSISYPRAVLNEVGARCINSTHRGYFRRKHPLYFKKLLCLTLLSSFTRVLAELEAKVYGNKMLKMEPGFYSKLKILMPETVSAKKVNHCFAEVDSLLRLGESSRASEVASKFIFGECFSQKESLNYIKVFEEIRIKLLARRRASG